MGPWGGDAEGLASPGASACRLSLTISLYIGAPDSLLGSYRLCSCSGNSRASPKPKTMAFLYYTSLWKDGFLTMDVRPETAKAGLSLAATGTSHEAGASPLCWLGGPGAASGRSYGPWRRGWTHSEDRWFSTASHLGGRFSPSSGGLHMGQPPTRPFHPQFCLAGPAMCMAVGTHVCPRASYAPNQPATPAAPSKHRGCPHPHVPTAEPAEGRSQEDLCRGCCAALNLQDFEAVAGTGTTPSCPRHRWAPLSQQHMRSGGNTSPPSACRGEPAHAIAGVPVAREPGRPAKRRAPAPPAGSERAYVRSEESWRG